MDTDNKPINQSAQRDPDADLSLFLYKSGKTFKNFLLWLGRGFKRIGGIFLVTLLFLFRNFIWLMVGLIAGLSYGLYKQSKGSGFTSSMVIKANYNSGSVLYNTIDYLNALIASKQTNDLAAIFSISPDEARKLSEFTIEPVKSEIITAEMYRQEFFQPDLYKTVRLDTFWTRIIKYE